jgi:hypothetical protein
MGVASSAMLSFLSFGMRARGFVDRILMVANGSTIMRFSIHFKGVTGSIDSCPEAMAGFMNQEGSYAWPSRGRRLDWL